MPVVGQLKVVANTNDLSAAFALFEGLGFGEVARVQAAGKNLERGLGLPGAALDVCIVSNGEVTVELVKHGTGSGVAARHDAPGFGFICLEVDDIEKTVAELREKDASFVSEPIVEPENGAAWVYVQGPGFRVALVEVLEAVSEAEAAVN